LSVADAWIAASAVLLRATLVHKDPEFEPLDIPQHRLPYK
jgi:predicted nucleic acid-binding protein